MPKDRLYTDEERAQRLRKARRALAAMTRKGRRGTKKRRQRRVRFRVIDCTSGTERIVTYALKR